MDWLTRYAADLHQAALIGTMALGLLLEAMAPLRRGEGASTRRWLTNLGLSWVNYRMILWLGPWLYHWAQSTLSGFPDGLLPRLHANFVVSVLVVLLALEAVAYIQHRASHRFQFLWRLHAVHHSDIALDVTTAERHHPIEVVFTATLNLLTMLLLAPDMAVVVVCNLLSTVVNILSHANLTCGERVNRWLGWLVVTPDFHRVHHASDRGSTNSNYGTVFSLFDHIFGTAKSWTSSQQRDEQLGLEYFRAPRDSRLDQLLLMPIRSDFAP